MGYGRRITFESEQRNANDNYFWSDNYPLGYAFSIHVVDAGLKFTIYDANRLALGTCEIVEVEVSSFIIFPSVFTGPRGSLSKSPRRLVSATEGGQTGFLKINRY